MKMGFELEFASPLDWGGIKRSLKRELGESYNKVIKHVTADYSIDIPLSLRYSFNSPSPVEIVTAPLPKRSALKNLQILFDWAIELGCVTNPSTGLHVNYSDAKVQHRLNPVSVLTTIDSKRILSEFHRERNRFCRPWEYYLKMIRSSHRRNYNSLIEGSNLEVSSSVGKTLHLKHFDEFVVSASKFMHWVNAGYYWNDMSKYGTRFTRYAMETYDNKRCCLNIGYIKRRGYIENRMLGNNYLKNQDAVYECIQEVEDGLLLACDTKYNTKRNYRYLKEFYFA